MTPTVPSTSLRLVLTLVVAYGEKVLKTHPSLLPRLLNDTSVGVITLGGCALYWKFILGKYQSNEEVPANIIWGWPAKFVVSGFGAVELSHHDAEPPGIKLL